VNNTGDAAASLETLAIDPAQVSGATFVSNTHADPPAGSGLDAAPGTAFLTNLVPDDAATVEYRFIARKNGRVTAASISGVSGQFALRTGVGDAGIPLSPDTLILPAYARELPESFYDVALRVLGLAHSVATAPASQDVGIHDRILRTLVDQRAAELSEAGLRVRVGEAQRRSLLDLWLDWLGNTTLDRGFDEILQSTGAGHALESVTCPRSPY
jgi:hypothetical protein